VTANHGVDWARARADAALDDRHAILVAYRVNKLQDRCADLWATMASGFGSSPFEFLVDLRLRDAALPFDALAAPLTAYLAERRPIDADQTFLERQADLERSAYRDLARVLDAGQVERLRVVAAGSLLNIATGHPAMARRLSALYDENRLKRGIDLFCQMPFEYAHIEDTGEVLPCCPSKFRLSIGNLKQNTMHEVWSSEAARAVRDSIHDKTFRFCNYYACEYLKKGRAIHGDN
jgi:hypothetical protein